MSEGPETAVGAEPSHEPGNQPGNQPGNKPGTGHSALVTGGNRGIGRAVVQTLLAEGYQVAATCRSGADGDVPEGALAVAADVTDTASVQAAVAAAEKAHGPVDVLVANAGITADALVLRADDQDFARVLDTNLVGAYRCVRAVMKGMVRLRRGRIVLVSSVVALSGSAGQTSYGASKAGLIGLARSLTREVAGRGITANVVAPGMVETDMTADLPEELRRSWLASIPAGRFADPEEVAQVVAFLAGPGSRYITGAVVPVDGGWGMGH